MIKLYLPIELIYLINIFTLNKKRKNIVYK